MQLMKLLNSVTSIYLVVTELLHQILYTKVKCLPRDHKDYRGFISVILPALNLITGLRLVHVGFHGVTHTLLLEDSLKQWRNRRGARVQRWKIKNEKYENEQRIFFACHFLKALKFVWVYQYGQLYWEKNQKK